MTKQKNIVIIGVPKTNILTKKLNLLKNQVKEIKNLAKFFGGSSISFLNQKLDDLYLERSILDEETKSLEESQTFFDQDHSQEIVSLEDLYSSKDRDILQIEGFLKNLKDKSKEIKKIKLFLKESSSYKQKIKNLNQRLDDVREEKEEIEDELEEMEKEESFWEDSEESNNYDTEIDILYARRKDNNEQIRHLKFLIKQERLVFQKLKEKFSKN